MISLIKKLFVYKEFRFLFVGGINTLFGYAVMIILMFFSISYQLSYLIATVLGIIHSYIWNKFFTFKTSKKSYAEIIRFVLVYTASFLLGLAILYILIQILGFNKYLAALINIVLTTVISWFGHNLFSFKKINANKENK